MKLPKKIYLAAAALLFVSGGVTAAVLFKNNPQPVALKQVSSISPQRSPETAQTDTSTADTQQPQVTTQPTETPAQLPPTPDENKAVIMAKISDYATSIGLTDVNGMVFAQTNCFDHAITSSVGYGSYDDLLDSAKLPILAHYLDGTVMFDGPVTCRVIPQVAH